MVCRYDYFGTGVNQSKVFIHEVGHYFNLRHTFSSGCSNYSCLTQGDYVCDTAPDALQSGGCNSINSCATDDDDLSAQNPFRPLSAGGLGDADDPIENFMDYSNRTCQTTFTQGQKDRMRLSLQVYRGSLLTSTGCVSIATNDVGITEIIMPDLFGCTSQPTVVLHNYGTQALTSAVIHLQVDGGVLYVQNWTGYLSPNELAAVAINTTFTFTQGAHSFYSYAAAPNGALDANNNNNDNSKSFYAIATQSLPFVEDFEEFAFGTKWLNVNPDASETWKKSAALSGCADNGSRSGTLAFRNYTTLAEPDYLYTRLNLSGYALSTLTFDLAYRQYSITAKDRLRVAISTDCGETFTALYDKSGGELSTTSSITTIAWSPTSCNDWRTETINLSDFAGQEVILAFIGVCYNGNNLYLDNVAVSGTTIPTCDAPTVVQVWNESENTADVIWVAPDPDAVSFNLRYRVAGTSSWLLLSNLSGLQRSLDNLFYNTNYEVSVQTVCNDGSVSGFTNAVTFTTDDTACPPATSLTLSDVDLTEATFQWQETMSDAIYKVYCYPVGSAPAGFSYAYEPTLSLTGLLPNTLYQVQIYTLCASGVSSGYTLNNTFTTIATCDVPDELAVGSVSMTTATFHWNANSEAFGYRLEYRLLGAAPWSNVNLSNIHSYNLIGLQASSLYEARLRRSCSDGSTSVFCTPIVFQTPGECIAPTLWLANAQATALSVGWVANSSNTVGYRLLYKQKGSTAPWDTLVTSDVNFTLSALPACQAYIFRIQSLCAEGAYSPLSGYYTYFTLSEDGYCCSYANSAFNHWIKEVKVGTAYTNNSGNNNGYGDFTASNIPLNAGSNYTLKLTRGVLKKGFGDLYWSVWIDFNHNLAFEASEKVYTTGSGGLIGGNPYLTTATIHIPNTALDGATRMRVSLKYGALPDACEIIEVGEMEDYTIFINNSEASEKTAELNFLQATLQPNPARETTLVNYFQSTSAPIEIRLFDVTNRLVHEQMLPASTAGQYTLQVANQTPGLYFVEISNGMSRTVQKLVVY